MAEEPQQWLLLTIATGTVSTLRVHAWRRLRSLGALYLQSSVSLLPARPETRKAIARLVDRVRREGGEARLLMITLTNPAEEQAVVEEFCGERSQEYAEICARTPGVLEDIATYRRPDTATYAEVEESEAELERLRKWLHRIEARDYFGADGRDEAEAAVARCQAALAEFEAQALAGTAVQAAVGKAPKSRRLRAVK